MVLTVPSNVRFDRIPADQRPIVHGFNRRTPNFDIVEVDGRRWSNFAVRGRMSIRGVAPNSFRAAVFDMLGAILAFDGHLEGEGYRRA